MPQPAPDSHRGVMLPALTSIRGVAAWYIVIFHFRAYVPTFGLTFLPGVWDRGYLSVDLFFVLSGFVVSLNYLAFLNRPGPRIRHAARFLWLRLGRIYPLHITVLLLMLANPLALYLSSAHGLAGNRYTPSYFILSVFLIQNWGFAKYMAWNIPSWSISTEWFVYLVFPAVAWLLHRARITAIGWAAMAVGLCALFALAWTALNVDLGNDIAQAGLARCVLEFLMGTCVHGFWAARRTAGRALHGDLAVGGAVLVAIGDAILGVPDAVAMPFCFVLLIYGLADVRAVSARVLAFGALEAVGVVSYSTYMLHFLVRDWVKFILLHHEGGQAVPTIAYLMATALLSVVFYHLVEVPGRNWFRSTRILQPRPSPSSRLPI